MVCAHGGLASKNVAPPNTAEAFHAALQLGVDCVEVDVARTRDGTLVVLHVRELHQLVSWISPAQQEELQRRSGLKELSKLQVSNSFVGTEHSTGGHLEAGGELGDLYLEPDFCSSWDFDGNLIHDETLLFCDHLILLFHK
jgi:glycerophosphoryl diester phosphodiesterase